MIIDVNAYLGWWPYSRIETRTANDLIELEDEFGIDQAVIVSTTSIFYDCNKGDTETTDAVRKHSNRLIGFASTSPLFEESLSQFEKSIKEHGMKGLKLFPRFHGYKLGDALSYPLIERAVKLKVPIMIPIRLSMNWSFQTRAPLTVGIAEISKLIQNFPDGRFILGGVGHSEFLDAMMLIKKCNNVSVETSCLQTWKGIETLVDEVGANRILFGTGMPVQYPGAGLARIEKAKISGDDRMLILSENAKNLLLL